MENDLNLLSLLNNTPMCIKLFDGDGKLIFINKYGRKEHSILDSDDISKWKWLDTVKKEYQAEVNKKFSEILNGSPVEYVEFEHTEEGSDHEWCSGALSSVKDEKGSVAGVLFYSIDISAKKNAEKAVMEKMHEIEKMNKFMVDRELRMINLKKELTEIKERYHVVGDNKN